MTRAATPAITVLPAAGVRHEILGYRHGSRVESFGDETVAALPDGRVPAFDRVACSAGKRGWDVVLAPGDLVELTAAVTADVTAQ